MIEITGDIFQQHDADAICVTTNGVVKDNGCLVMGKGIAKKFALKYPQLPLSLGKCVKESGNQVHIFGTDPGLVGDPELIHKYPYVVSFPTKENWADPSPIELIIKSAHELVVFADLMMWIKVILPRPGCSNGGLDWESQVKPVLEPILDDRFYIITPALEGL